MGQISAIEPRAARTGIAQTWRAALTLAALAAMASFAGSAAARQAAQAANSSGGTNSATAQDPLAAAARKAKAEHSHAAQAKVFTNDNLPTEGVVSTVGVVPATPSAASGKPATAGRGASASSAQGETYWRDKFAAMNKKLAQDQAELDVMQRELGQLNIQNYSDPNKAMQQGYSRGDIDEKTAAIAAKQKDVQADQQAISDAETDLRKSGGDSGWSR